MKLVFRTFEQIIIDNIKLLYFAFEHIVRKTYTRFIDGRF